MKEAAYPASRPKQPDIQPNDNHKGGRAKYSTASHSELREEGDGNTW